MSDSHQGSHNTAIKVAIISGIFTVIVACIGLGVPVIEWLLNMGTDEGGTEARSIAHQKATSTQALESAAMNSLHPVLSDTHTPTEQPTISEATPTSEPSIVVSTERGLSVILPDTSHVGTLADGAFDDYIFKGFANTPVLISIERTDGNLGYTIEIYDSDDEQVYDEITCYNTGGREKFHFTPSKNDDFIIRVIGCFEYGDYEIGMTWIDGPPETRNQIVTIRPDTSYVGTLANGAFDDYIFKGFANTPVLISIERTDGNLGYTIEIYDSNDEQAYDEITCYNAGGREKFHFTPSKDDDFIIRVIGCFEYGDYRISMKTLE